MKAAGLPMTEFAQTTPALTEASSNLFEIIMGRAIALYPDEAMRLSASRCIALETSRGWRIAKEKQSHKIDVIVALAQACLAATRGTGEPNMLRYYRSLAWPDLYPLAKPTAVPLEETPEYKAMLRGQQEPCARCGLPLGPRRIQIMIDKAIHAGGCPRAGAEHDSFGDPIPEGRGFLE